MIYDLIVIGAGSAGCVLANRVSAESNLQVLLIEAGLDVVPNEEPEDIMDTYAGRAYVNARYRWRDIKAHLGPLPSDGPIPPGRDYEQARLMGGTSSINGQVALRGARADYDTWSKLGAKGWSWPDVLPYFRRLERDFDFDGEEHGISGPIAIRRIFPSQWDRLATATAQAMRAQGYECLADLNAEYQAGFGALPLSNAYGRRVSSATGYLSPAIRQRPNLRIVTCAQALRVVVQAGRAAGVEVQKGGSIETVHAREIVLSAGVMNSPRLMMLSGLGPADDLKQLGIEVQMALPGVGKNLHDHAAISISAYLPKDARFNTRIRRHSYINLRYSSYVGDCPPTDMVLNPVSRSAWHPLGERLCTFQVFIAKPFSRGVVKITSGRPEAAVDAHFNFLSDERDCSRLMHGLRLVRTLTQHSSLRQVALDPFPSSYSVSAQSIARLTFFNAILTKIAGSLLEGPGSIRRQIIKTFIAGGATLETLFASDASLEDYVRKNVSVGWHACGTCRMGDENDPAAVVDPYGRVRNVSGLWVADASIIPEIPRSNINIPTIMLAEKISDHLLGVLKRGHVESR